MDYGNLLTRAWNIIWTHKYLILLGVLVALGSGGGSFGSADGLNFGARPSEGGFEFRGPLPDFSQGGPLAGLAVAVVIGLICIGIIIGLGVWVVSTIARGGLIAGVNAIDAGTTSSFGPAWQAGWAKGWQLIGIGIIPLIPVLILLVVGLGTAGIFASLSSLGVERMAVPARAGLGVTIGIVTCITIPVALVLNLLRTFANRACMLEGRGVWASYSRGWNVLVDNIGSALILFLIQIVIGIGLAILLFLPSLILLLCCILWPVFLFIQGAIAAYFSTVWTLAWREWTGLGYVGVGQTEG